MVNGSLFFCADNRTCQNVEVFFVFFDIIGTTGTHANFSFACVRESFWSFQFTFPRRLDRLCCCVGVFVVVRAPSIGLIGTT